MPQSYLLKRHPFSMRAHFRFSLVLAYAFPAEILQPLLAPGLVVDDYEGAGFLAVAIVAAEHMRPAFVPQRLGLNFMLAGFRIFTRYTTADGRQLRGLRILRSETNSGLMQRAGNALTHYQYRRSVWHVERTASALDIRVETADGSANLDVTADLASLPAPLPAGSPFPDLKTARRFAGPLPFTFDYEAETNSIIRVEGVRTNWRPEPIRVDVRTNAFVRQTALGNVEPVLANAFIVEDVPYMWRRGVREVLQPAL